MYAMHAEAKRLLPFFRPITKKTSRKIRRPFSSTMPNIKQTVAFCQSSRVM